MKQKAPVLSYKCHFCNKEMNLNQNLSNVNHIMVHTDCIIKDIEDQLNNTIGVEYRALQEAYDQTMEEINRLRKRLQYA